MTSYSNGGVFNPAYHDSETLEIDRRSSRKHQHANPYAREDPAWWVESAEPRAEAEWRTSGDGWSGRENLPMGLISTRPGSPSWQHDLNHSGFQIGAHSQYDQSQPVRLHSSTSGNMTVRWRGITMRRMSLFPNADPAHAAFTEDAIKSEMENEEENLVKELVALSTAEQIRKIRELPMSFEEKKYIRRQVMAVKSSKQSHQFTCLSDCSRNVSLSVRRCGYSLNSARQTLELWHGIMKEIGGKFGSSVLNYFVLLKWLLMFNIFSFLINFGFITIPLLVSDFSPNTPSNVGFKGLELLTGAGYFNYTIMYYGSYSNETLGQPDDLMKYNMQLAYFFTIAVYMVLCGIVLIFSMASSFKKNYALADPASNSAWQLLCSWDFSMTNERAVNQRKNNLRVQLKESLSERAQTELPTVSEKLKHYGIHFGSWLLSTSLAVACGASIFYLCRYEDKRAVDTETRSLLREAETLLVPFVVSLMNMVIPFFFSLFNKFEHYSNQRKQIYALLFRALCGALRINLHRARVRNVLLRMSILGVLCYYWMNMVPQRFTCWEPVVGQALYRLVIVDFLFLMLGCFFGEFLGNVIGTKLQPRLGVPEFDVARNVLEIIYAQTLAWIGIYFSPLLPAIQILKFFILFYVKKVSLTQNCQPPRRSSRAAQMKTIFIFLLFFPFFVGALSIVAYTTWSLTPSEHCGPFRGLNRTFSVVGEWVDELDNHNSTQWVVWTYQNVIRSELFYFLITLIFLVIIYIFWQLIQGRKKLIVLLKQQIFNEGEDKSYLLEKLQKLQKSGPKYNRPKKQITRTNQRSVERSPGSQSNSNAVVQVLLARQQLEEEERRSASGVSVPADISTSDALMQALLARQKAERQDENVFSIPDEPSPSLDAVALSMAARQRAEERDGNWSTTDFNQSNPVSSVMIQVLQARQRAEGEERDEWTHALGQNSAPPGSSALIQAMLARQEAQNEYDDGY